MPGVSVALLFCVFPKAFSRPMSPPGVLGVVGSFVGGMIGNLIEQGELTFELQTSGILGSLLGSIALLLVMRVFR